MGGVMNGAVPRSTLERILGDFLSDGSGLPSIWGRRAFWQVRFRWFVPPVILAAVLVGRHLGFEFGHRAVVLVAVGIFAYNLVFALIFVRWAAAFDGNPGLDRLFTVLQVVIDYSAMFVLIAATGGPVSPLIFFFIFHVVLAAIQFRPGTTFLFASMATGGLWLLTLLQVAGLLPRAVIRFRGAPFDYMDWPAQMLVLLGFFTASVLIAALLATRVMVRLRRRIQGLAEVSGQVSRLNERLGRLHTMLRSVGSEQRLAPILELVTSQLAVALDLPVVAVKLLSEDGRTLSFAAAHGLPTEFTSGEVVQLAGSPLNRRVVEGETLVLSRVDRDGDFQLHPEFIARGIRSVVFAPLTLEQRVIGVLAGYAPDEDHFDSEDEDFLRLAAELVAVAVENARGYEANRELMKEHTRFMMQVAHNMRAPLGASLSMLELLDGDYLGEVNETQHDYLDRIAGRIRGLHETIGTLLVIGRTRDRTRNIIDVTVDLPALVRRVGEEFREEATARELDFRVTADPALPLLPSGADLIVQMLENLVSNAIKYTPAGGKVELAAWEDDEDWAVVSVVDTGIGIPAAEQGRLGQEFFRASNAKGRETVGTGLGLSFVKQAVDRHGGRMRIDSEEGRGTRVVLHLPTIRATSPTEAEETGGDDGSGKAQAARRGAGRLT
jgi:signal transduction histidine kinase